MQLAPSLRKAICVLLACPSPPPPAFPVPRAQPLLRTVLQLLSPFTDSLLPSPWRPLPGQCPGVVSERLRREESLLWSCCPQSCSCSPGCSCCSQLQGHTDESSSMSCSQGLPCPFLQSCFCSTVTPSLSCAMGCSGSAGSDVSPTGLAPPHLFPGAALSMHLQLCRSRRSLPSVPKVTSFHPLPLSGGLVFGPVLLWG